MKIDFANLNLQYKIHKSEIDNSMKRVLQKSNFIMGEEVFKLEKILENFTNAKYCITCSNGTDALILAMMSLGIGRGDEVITTPFSYISTAEIISIMGAKPVFCDIDFESFNINEEDINKLITKKTKAILPVSLFGQPANLTKIEKIAKDNNLKVIIDGAQSFGSTINNIKDSYMGDISTTSFFPAKPLGCYGDGGAVFTNKKNLAEKIKMLRIHGQNKRYHHKFIGLGARLDTLQAAVLISKMKFYKKEIIARQKVANYYEKELSNINHILTPKIAEKKKSVWAQYTIRVKKKRDFLQNQLYQANIPNAIHYPKPMHLQQCFRYLGYKRGDFPVAESASKEVLSLPMNPYLKKSQLKHICSVVRESLKI